MCGTRSSGVLSSIGDVLEMSVVRGVDGVCDMYMCLARGGVGGEGVSGLENGVWASSILWGLGECWTWVCVLVVVVWVGVLDQGRERWGGV